LIAGNACCPVREFDRLLDREERACARSPQARMHVRASRSTAERAPAFDRRLQHLCIPACRSAFIVAARAKAYEVAA